MNELNKRKTFTEKMKEFFNKDKEKYEGQINAKGLAENAKWCTGQQEKKDIVFNFNTRSDR